MSELDELVELGEFTLPYEWPCPDCGCCWVDQDAGHDGDPNCPCWHREPGPPAAPAP